MQSTPRHCLLAVLVAWLAAMPAVGDDFVWNQPDGGIFGDAENWNDGAGGVPGVEDVALFDLFVLFPGYTVQLTESRTTDRLVVRRGLMSLSLTQSDFVYELLSGNAEQPGITIADEARQIATVTLRGGVFRASHVTVGKSPASSGSLDLGTGGTLETDVLIVGDAGTGFMSVSGDTAQVGRVEVGVGTSGYGELTMTSPLIVVDELVAGGAGLGIVKVLGSVEAASVIVGRDAGGTGRLTIDGGAMTVDGDLEIGRNGAGELRFLLDGRVEVGDALRASTSSPDPTIRFVLSGMSPTTARLSVAGVAAVSVVAIELGHAYTPDVGDEFALITASSGLEKTTILPPALPAVLASEIIVTDTDVLLRIVANACPPGPGEDCNANNTRDDCDIARGTSFDCNWNQRPDECDIADAISDDCNANGVPDECDIASGTSQDCNENRTPDTCDIGDGTSVDCNGNGMPEECDIRDGTSQDCTDDGVPDVCTPALVADRLLDALGQAGDAFGSAVDAAGTLAVVGSPEASPPFVTVFALRGTRWVRETRITTPDDAPGDGFGSAVAIDASTLVVGAPTADDGGAAYVYERDANGAWSMVTTLGVPDGFVLTDGFGASVDASGGSVLVGARQQSVGRFRGIGYIFARDRAWDQVTLFFTMLSDASVLSGASVSIDDRRALILWPGDDTGNPGVLASAIRDTNSNTWSTFAGNPLPGAVGPDVAVDVPRWAFRIETDAFRGVRVFPSSDGASIAPPAGDTFGAALGMSDGRLAVGAVGDGPGGRVYTYRLLDDTWHAEETLAVPTSGAIGAAVALEGVRLITGAPTDDTQGLDAGAAWITALPGPDCNDNGMWDACDIVNGRSADADGDGVPDECADTCPYDLDESGVVGFNDLSIVLSSWGSCPNCLADVSESGSVGFLELSGLLQAWGDCP